MARFAYTAFCATKNGCFLPWLLDLHDESRHSIWERHSGRPIDEFVHRQAALVYYLLDLADEARALCRLRDQRDVRAVVELLGAGRRARQLGGGCHRNGARRAA